MIILGVGGGDGRPHSLKVFNATELYAYKQLRWGRLGGSVGSASDFGSGHDLPVRAFEPCIGLCADVSEPGARFGFCVSFSLCPSPIHALSLPQK